MSMTGADGTIYYSTDEAAANASAASTQFYQNNPTLVDPATQGPSAIMGNITKQQWTDYQNRFVPLENQLMNMSTYNNPALASQEIGKSEADTGKTYDNIAGSQAIQLGRYGMSATPDQQASSDRLNQLGRTGSVVDAANNIRLKLVERNQSIASGAAQSTNTTLK